jgi:hypothetical protein
VHPEADDPASARVHYDEYPVAVQQNGLTAKEIDAPEAVFRVPKKGQPGGDKIALRVGRVVHKYKVAKRFELEITERSFSYRRREKHIAAEAALHGLYVIRTSVPSQVMDAQDTVRAYKGLSEVERAFRSYKSVDLKVRPIYHHLPDRVRAHVFLCMLAYYVEWHMREKLAPLLFDDDDPETAQAARASIVAPAQPSPSAREKAHTQRTAEGHPVHSFHTLLDDLATIVKNRIQPKLPGAIPFDKITRPTSLQHRALDLLGVRL